MLEMKIIWPCPSPTESERLEWGIQEFKALGWVKCMLKFENHCYRYSWHTVNIQKVVYVASSSGIIPKYICFFPFFSQYHHLSSRHGFELAHTIFPSHIFFFFLHNRSLRYHCTWALISVMTWKIISIECKGMEVRISK